MAKKGKINQEGGGLQFSNFRATHKKTPGIFLAFKTDNTVCKTTIICSTVFSKFHESIENINK